MSRPMYQKSHMMKTLIAKVWINKLLYSVYEGFKIYIKDLDIKYFDKSGSFVKKSLKEV